MYQGEGAFVDAFFKQVFWLQAWALGALPREPQAASSTDLALPLLVCWGGGEGKPHFEALQHFWWPPPFFLVCVWGMLCVWCVCVCWCALVCVGV